jgi:hypothetical protein
VKSEIQRETKHQRKTKQEKNPMKPAARGTAADGSVTTFILSHMSRIEDLISSSLTVMTFST